MADLVITIILAAIIGLAARYVYKAKKSGAKCIGCSVEGGCSHSCSNASCSCGCDSCHSDSN